MPKVTQLPRSRAGSKPKHSSCTVSASLTEALHTGTGALDWQSAGLGQKGRWVHVSDHCFLANDLEWVPPGHVGSSMT